MTWSLARQSYAEINSAVSILIHTSPITVAEQTERKSRSRGTHLINLNNVRQKRQSLYLCGHEVDEDILVECCIRSGTFR